MDLGSDTLLVMWIANISSQTEACKFFCFIDGAFLNRILNFNVSDTSNFPSCFVILVSTHVIFYSFVFSRLGVGLPVIHFFLMNLFSVAPAPHAK